MLVTGKVRQKYDALSCAPGAATTAQTVVVDGLGATEAARRRK